ILGQLFEALEVPNAQAAAARAAELMKSAATLAKLLPEFEAMRDRLAGVDEQDAQTEVDIAMQAHAMPPSARKSMLLHRKSDVDVSRKPYPLPDPRLAHLMQPVHTPAPTTASSPLDRIQAGGGGLRLKPPLQPPPPLGGAGGLVDLTAFAGANNVERAMNML